MSLWQLLPLALCTNIAQNSDLTQYTITSIPVLDDVMPRNHPVIGSYRQNQSSQWEPLDTYVIVLTYRVRNTSQSQGR